MFRAHDEDEDDGSAMLLIPDRLMRRDPTPPDVHLQPASWRAFQIFTDCQTQWRFGQSLSGAERQGLDYAAVWSVINGLRVKNPGKVFRDIQYLEVGALGEFRGRQNVSDNTAH